MIRIFAGYDRREAVGHYIFCDSVISRTRAQVSFTPVADAGSTDGSNKFTYARFGVPALCGYEGWAIFADACDQLCLGDIEEVWALRDEAFAVRVVKHAYRTRNKIKYLGTSMQCPNMDYPRKNWSSLMLMNCAAPEWRELEKFGLARAQHQFQGVDPLRIGTLPECWNVLVDEGQTALDPKLLHWTAGIPHFAHYENAPFAELWFAARDALVSQDV